MRKLVFICAIAFFAACSNNQGGEKKETATVDTTLQYFGDSITIQGAVPANQLAAMMKGKDSLAVKLEGTIEEVCQKKGCWMNVSIGNNQSMKVRFKDYSFFVPKDAARRKVFLQGFAKTDTTSVKELQHYAEDAGKSKEEIAKITHPEINIGFEANGVIIKK